jgi:hypothetical protein
MIAIETKKPRLEAEAAGGTAPKGALYFAGYGIAKAMP